MSHSDKDAVGGHRTAVYWDDGVKGAQMIGRRWHKKFNRREARREAKATITNALSLLAEEVQDYYHEAMDTYADDQPINLLDEMKRRGLR